MKGLVTFFPNPYGNRNTEYQIFVETYGKGVENVSHSKVVAFGLDFCQFSPFVTLEY